MWNFFHKLLRRSPRMVVWIDFCAISRTRCKFLQCLKQKPVHQYCCNVEQVWCRFPGNQARMAETFIAFSMQKFAIFDHKLYKIGFFDPNLFWLKFFENRKLNFFYQVSVLVPLFCQNGPNLRGPQIVIFGLFLKIGSFSLKSLWKPKTKYFLSSITTWDK